MSKKPEEEKGEIKLPYRILRHSVVTISPKLGQYKKMHYIIYVVQGYPPYMLRVPEDKYSEEKLPEIIAEDFKRRGRELE